MYIYASGPRSRDPPPKGLGLHFQAWLVPPREGITYACKFMHICMPRHGHVYACTYACRGIGMYMHEYVCICMYMDAYA